MLAVPFVVVENLVSLVSTTSVERLSRTRVNEVVM